MKGRTLFPTSNLFPGAVREPALKNTSKAVLKIVRIYIEAAKWKKKRER